MTSGNWRGKDNSLWRYGGADHLRALRLGGGGGGGGGGGVRPALRERERVSILIGTPFVFQQGSVDWICRRDRLLGDL